MLVPLLVVEVLILLQFYRINHNDVDEINNSLNKVSSDMEGSYEQYEFYFLAAGG